MDTEQAGGGTELERVTGRWLRWIWLPIVTLITIGTWWLSYLLNPAKVPTWLILGTAWLWMWLWWKAQHVVKALRVVWFGPRVMVVTLTVIGLVWSLTLPILRDGVLIRSTSPDELVTVVVTGLADGTTFEVNRETVAGLLLDEVATVWIGETPGYPSSGPPKTPEELSVVWHPEEGLEVRPERGYADCPS